MNNSFFYIENKNITQDLTETARYLGYKKSNPPEEKIQKLIEKAACEMKSLLKPQGVYQIFPLEIIPIEKAEKTSACANAQFKASADKTEKAEINFANVKIISRDLYNNLKTSTNIALFAATIGPQIDSYIRRAQAIDPVYASICQATGAMYIEKFVDLLNEEIKNQGVQQGYKTTPRYSPGYGDISLEIQKDFFSLLNCNRIGLTLMDTLIMAPEKSVTAFVGLYK